MLFKHAHSNNFSYTQMMNSSSRETAMAAVLQNFLPVLDDLELLDKKYGADDFGKSFSALGGTMKSALKELGVEEYTVQVGDAVNKQRVTVVEEEYSEEFTKDTVIRPVSVGMELQGNIMRMAECVASLGSESAAAAAEEVVAEQGVAEQGVAEQGVAEEVEAEQGAAEQGAAEQDAAEEGSSEEE